MTIKLNAEERNGYILYLGYNNYHVEKLTGYTWSREFDDYRDARAFFLNISQRGNK